MKVTYQLLFFCLFLSNPSVFGQQCSDYDCVIRKVKKAMADKNYRLAFQQLKSADSYPNKNSLEISKLNEQLFDLTESDRESAIAAKNDEARAKNDAIASKNDAIASKLASTARAVIATEKDFITSLRIANAATKVTETPTVEAISSLHDIVSEMSFTSTYSQFNCIKKFGTVNLNSINYMKLSNDMKFFVSSSIEDSLVRIWDVKNGMNFQNFKTKFDCNNIALSLDNKSIIIREGYDRINIYNFSSNKPIHTYKDTLKSIFNVFFYNNKPLLINTTDSTIRIFDINTKSLFKTFVTNARALYEIKTSNNGKYIIGLGSDNLLKIWDIEKGVNVIELENKIFGSTGNTNGIAFSTDNKFLAINKNRIVEIWDLAEKKLLKTLDGHSNRVNTINFSNDGKYLLCGEENGKVRIWNIGWGQMVQSINVSMPSIPIIGMTPDNRYVIIYAQYGVLMTWRTIEDYLDPEKSANLTQEQRRGYGVPDWVKD
jgi:WD40 repeat protein